MRRKYSSCPSCYIYSPQQLTIITETLTPHMYIYLEHSYLLYLYRSLLRTTKWTSVITQGGWNLNREVAFHNIFYEQVWENITPRELELCQSSYSYTFRFMLELNHIITLLPGCQPNSCCSKLYPVWTASYSSMLC